MAGAVVGRSEGKVGGAGPPDEGTADPRVIEAYLGHGGAKRGAA